MATTNGLSRLTIILNLSNNGLWHSIVPGPSSNGGRAGRSSCIFFWNVLPFSGRNKRDQGFHHRSHVYRDYEAGEIEAAVELAIENTSAQATGCIMF